MIQGKDFIYFNLEYLNFDKIKELYEKYLTVDLLQPYNNIEKIEASLPNNYTVDKMLPPCPHPKTQTSMKYY